MARGEIGDLFGKVANLDDALSSEVCRKQELELEVKRLQVT
jgi:hypothetical protein